MLSGANAAGCLFHFAASSYLDRLSFGSAPGGACHVFYQFSAGEIVEPAAKNERTAYPLSVGLEECCGFRGYRAQRSDKIARSFE